MSGSLLDLLRFTRGGPAPEPVELTESEWGRWAGARYAWEVRSHRAPSLVGLGPDKICPGGPASRALARVGLYRRKVTAMVLAERAETLGFVAQAERFSRVSEGLSCGLPSESSRAFKILRQSVLDGELGHRISEGLDL